MYEPMAANTLAESAEWLTEHSGRPWSARQVLDEIIRRGTPASPAALGESMTAAFVLPPKSTPFSVYEPASDGVHSRFRALHLNYKFPLSLISAEELFDYDESQVHVASLPSNIDDRLVLIEPQNSGLLITSRMVRLERGTLISLATGSFEDINRPYRLPRFTMLGAPEDDDNRAATWWSLRVLAHHYGWEQKDSRPVIDRCLNRLPVWESSVISVLMSGPRAVADSRAPANIKHVQKRRVHVLDAEIAHARTLSIDPDDSHSVFGALCKLAENQYGVLLGLDERAIKYRKGEDVAFFEHKQLSSRMQRAKIR